MSSVSLSASDIRQIVTALRHSARDDGIEESHCSSLARTLEHALDTVYFSGTGFSRAVVSFSTGSSNARDQPPSTTSHSTFLGNMSVPDGLRNQFMETEPLQCFMTGASSGTGLSNALGPLSQNTDFAVGNSVPTSFTPLEPCFLPRILEDDLMLTNLLTSNISNGLTEGVVWPLETIDPRSLLPASSSDSRLLEQGTTYNR
ncbi:hypothetical protein CVT26_005306, partial [Gymnopilus dilepis]